MPNSSTIMLRFRKDSYWLVDRFNHPDGVFGEVLAIACIECLGSWRTYPAVIEGGNFLE